jgi:hypothetical protein
MNLSLGALLFYGARWRCAGGSRIPRNIRRGGAQSTARRSQHKQLFFNQLLACTENSSGDPQALPQNRHGFCV